MPTARGWLILILAPLVGLAATPLFAEEALAEEPQALLGWRSSSVEANGKNPPHASSGAATMPQPGLPSPEPISKQLQPVSAAPLLEPTPTNDQRPRALLIRNPNAEAGESPFALADNQGQVQRLVEPTVGVNLEKFLGQVVRVNHDTGAVLLASQLELPGAMSAPGASPARFAFNPAASGLGVTMAQYERGEPLPEPIVLEEVVGVPEGAGAGALQFPSSLQPAPTVVDGPMIGSPSHPSGQPPAAACVGCGAIVQGPYGHTACVPGCPLVGLRWPALRGGNLDFSVEALWLRTHDSASSNSASDFDLATRWELGISPSWDRRVAVRYFEYDTNLAVGTLDLDVIDLESQRWFQLGPAATVGVGGGVRWADYNETNQLSNSDSFGPVLGVYARAAALPRLDGTFHLRQSWQFADTGATGQRGTYGITEFQLGLEHRRQIRAGEAFVRGVLETQYWNDVKTGNNSNSSHGMVGVGVGAGIRR